MNVCHGFAEAVQTGSLRHGFCEAVAHRLTPYPVYE